MAQGAGSNAVPGFVELNAPQSAANVNNQPTVILDDPVTGSLAVHLGGKTPVPTTIAVVAAGAGTAGTAALDANATDLCGTITLVTGSGSWGTGAQATVTFATALTKTAYVVFFPAESVAASLAPTVKPYVTNVAAGAGFSLAFQVADSAAHTTKWNYVCLGN